jgi:hypothetical protein
MQIARFDFSYLDQQLHQTSIDNLRKASKATRQLCATMMDTLGPEIVVTNRCAFSGTPSLAWRQRQPQQLVGGWTAGKNSYIPRAAALSLQALCMPMYRFHELATSTYGLLTL